jgi:5-methylcytosine-specific restriction endonuclease McrA
MIMEERYEDRRHYMGRIPKDLRYIVLERDDFRCKFCGVGGKDSDIILEVHHVIWRNLGGLDEPENLITVCPHCHDIVHYGKIIERPFTFSELKLKQEGS